MTDAAPVSSPGSARWALPAACALLLAGALLHVWFLVDACPLDLVGDEAHYWEWARRLDFSYYSKGPLVAWIIAGSRALLADWSERLVGSEALAVRLPAVVLAFFTGLGIYVLASAVSRRPRVALLAAALTFTMPILAAGSMLMTIDAPLACAWTWALVGVERAMRQGSLLAWLAVGVLIAGGILAKYTMVLIFPAVGLLLLVDGRGRAQLRRLGPYLATVIGVLGFVPILAWNAAHNWVSFRHVAGQAGLAGGPSIDLLGPLSYVGGQLGVIGLWFPGMIAAIVAFYRRPAAEGEPHEATGLRLLLLAAVVPWALFLAFSPITKVQPNWPMLSLMPATILLAMWLARRWRAASAPVRRNTRIYVVASVVCGAGVVTLAHHAEWLLPLGERIERMRPSPAWEQAPYAKYDPTARLRGWSQLGREVGEVLAAERAQGRDPFIMADHYQLASEIAFYCPGEPDVYCIQPVLGSRLSQYDLWTNPIANPERFVGRPCIYVGKLAPVLTGAEGVEAALPGLGTPVRVVEHRVSGRYVVRAWPIYVADRFAGFAAGFAATQLKY
ncbi:MAG: glycosyltransferase family 39 protein [Phycisphaerae bacterium]|jgi:hypothetical protein